MSQYLDTLNTNQRKAATQIHGYELMLAGAGTGKTHTLISRVAYMIEQGIHPANILLLTFTRKASMEMQTRLKQYIGEQGGMVQAGTFHSFIWKVLQANKQKLGLDEHMRILDSGDDETLLRSIRKAYLADKNLSKAELREVPSVSVIKDLLSFATNSMSTMEEAAQKKNCEAYFLYQDMVQDIVDAYRTAKEREHYYNFDDIMVIYLALLEQNQSFHDFINRQYPYVLCDEYQDTNLLQDAILRRMTDVYHNLCVVGDDNQSIYRFRAAEIENILNFESAHDNCQVVPLLENYRSTQEILDVSNAMMEESEEGIPKYLHGQTHGSKPKYWTVDDDRAAADKILEDIKEHHKLGVPYKNHCVLVRKALTSWYVERACMLAKIPYQKMGGKRFTEEKNVKVLLNCLRHCVLVRKALTSWYVERACMLAKIPYQKMGGKRFTEEKNVKVLLNCLRISQNDKDTMAWRGVLPEIPGVGAKSVEQLSQLAGEHGVDVLLNAKKYGFPLRVQTALQVLQQFWVRIQTPLYVKDKLSVAGVFYTNLLEGQIQRTSSSTEKDKIAERLKKLKPELEMLIDMSEDMRSVSNFLDDLTLDAKVEPTQGDDVLMISTIHSAKGLEWEHVYVLHPVEDVFVDWNASMEDIAEERRVLYVALTRAKKTLTLVQAEMMQLNGKMVFTQMSRYLDTPKVRQTLEFQS